MTGKAASWFDKTGRWVFWLVQWAVILSLVWLALITYVFPASAAGDWMREHRDLVRQYHCSHNVPDRHLRGYLVEVTTKGQVIVWHASKGAVHETRPIPGRTLVIRAECRR